MLNNAQIEILKSVISNAAKTAYEEGQMMLVCADAQSPYWRAHDWEAGDCPNHGFLIAADGVQEARGEFYEDICRDDFRLNPENGLPL
jgi:hypothetical protein